MLKGRSVGTLTAGIVLVLFGVMFLARTMLGTLDYKLIFSFWPLIFVLLGTEITLSYIINKNEKLRYDGGAIALVIILTFFAMGMAGVEFAINNSKVVNGHWII